MKIQGGKKDTGEKEKKWIGSDGSGEMKRGETRVPRTKTRANSRAKMGAGRWLTHEPEFTIFCTILVRMPVTLRMPIADNSSVYLPTI